MSNKSLFLKGFLMNYWNPHYWSCLILSCVLNNFFFHLFNKHSLVSLIRKGDILFSSYAVEWCIAAGLKYLRLIVVTLMFKVVMFGFFYGSFTSVHCINILQAIRLKYLQSDSELQDYALQVMEILQTDASVDSHALVSHQ